MRTSKPITLDDLRGQPGFSQAAIDALVALQPETVLRALRIRGVGRKTTQRLLACGAIRDPEGIQNRRITKEEFRRSRDEA